LGKRKGEQPDLPPGEERVDRFRGPWHVVEADAMHSRNYTGKVSLGTYTEPDRIKGVLAKRVQDVTAQGYRNVAVREIPKEAE
jgi:hypothetical protein